MSKKKQPLENLPPGFSERDFIPINVKYFKNKEGNDIIEKKTEVNKTEEVKYDYNFSGEHYFIMRFDEKLMTPGGNEVMTKSKELAIRAIEHLNTYGEDYESAYSIVSFIYSGIDFFEQSEKEELVSAILKDFEEDWTFDCPYKKKEEKVKWIDFFGTKSEQIDTFKTWLKGLSKTQLGGVISLGASLDSVNTAFLLSSKKGQPDLGEFTRYYDKSYHAYFSRRSFYQFFTPEQTVKLFENYMFWMNLVE